MKKIYLFLMASMMMASCSAPKYAYYFDRYSPARKVAPASEKVYVASVEKEADLTLAPTVEPVVVSQETPAVTVLTGAEKKALKHAIRQAVRETKKSHRIQEQPVKVSHASSGMDHDLKLAAIFGAVGLVGLILGGSSGLFYIIGGISMIIGVVFFVKWLIRQ
ncbi:MAG: hypothetical protein K1X47_15140 [Cyclobacteriaceae bacterium]|nr:hypothetical protein [Cyclobacteriaceae bacterium]